VSLILDFNKEVYFMWCFLVIKIIIIIKSWFKGILLEILCTFCKGLDRLYRNLHTPHDLTGDEYEVEARIHLGFQAVQIFGTANVTATLKQIISCDGYHVDKALTDAQIIGLPVTLRNFQDGIMETAHKQNKKHRRARHARVIFLCEVSEIGAFMELFTVMIWLT